MRFDTEKRSMLPVEHASFNICDAGVISAHPGVFLSLYSLPVRWPLQRF